MLFWAIAVFSGTVWNMSVWELKAFRNAQGKLQMHHAYLGAALALVASLFLWQGLAVVAVLLGLWWLVDDAENHLRQLIQQLSGVPVTYESPWHRWYVWVVSHAIALWAKWTATK
jgi:hypothetical protein